MGQLLAAIRRSTFVTCLDGKWGHTSTFELRAFSSSLRDMIRSHGNALSASLEITVSGELQKSLDQSSDRKSSFQSGKAHTDTSMGYRVVRWMAVRPPFDIQRLGVGEL